MPGMDGIETAKIIRSLGYTKPIVALTANVITGQAEMFFANGFDDFISKPIDIRQLDVVLNKHIRDKYPEETIEIARKIKEKMEKRTGKQSLKPELAKIFTRDAQKATGVLESIYKKQNNCKDEDFQSYVINVHAMKSALANIGEAELSSVAHKLEEAGREKNIYEIIKETPAFLSALRGVIEKINPKKDDGDNAVMGDIMGEDREFLLEKLSLIREACAENSKKAAKDALSQLRQKKWPHSIMEIMDTIAEYLLHSDFSEAAKLAEDYIRTHKIN